MADRVIVNKTDLVSDETVGEIERMIRRVDKYNVQTHTWHAMHTGRTAHRTPVMRCTPVVPHTCHRTPRTCRLTLRCACSSVNPLTSIVRARHSVVDLASVRTCPV